MDPLSISTAAAGFTAICVSAIRLIKTTIETVKNAKRLLIHLLTQLERFRLLLEQVRGLTRQLGNRSGLALSYNDSSPKVTMSELKIVVQNLAETKNFFGIQTLLHKHRINVLQQKLSQHEGDLYKLLLAIATASAVRTEDQVRELHQRFLSRSQVVTAFEKLSISTASGGLDASIQAEGESTLQLWFGDTYREGFGSKYLELRDRLSNAAYYGHWKEVFQTLQMVKETTGQLWINAPRLSDDPAICSGWTPLHQAIYMNASKEVVERLLELGAIRTLRTQWADLDEVPFADISPLEMAVAFGYSDLYEILSPTIEHIVPDRVISRLEEQFHSLIKSDLGETESKHLRLPDLGVLRELHNPEMWLQLKSSDPKQPRGYLYHLEDRELVVEVYNIPVGRAPQQYRITEQEVQEIMEAVMFNREIDFGSSDEL